MSQCPRTLERMKDTLARKALHCSVALSVFINYRGYHSNVHPTNTKHCCFALFFSLCIAPSAVFVQWPTPHASSGRRNRKPVCSEIVAALCNKNSTLCRVVSPSRPKFDLIAPKAVIVLFLAKGLEATTGRHHCNHSCT